MAKINEKLAVADASNIPLQAGQILQQGFPVCPIYGIFKVKLRIESRPISPVDINDGNSQGMN